MTMVAMKKCAHEGCDFEFPAHYFHETCPAHVTTESEARAEALAELLVPRGRQHILALSAVVGFSTAEVRKLQSEFATVR